jgi:hypothetical protein
VVKVIAVKPVASASSDHQIYATAHDRFTDLYPALAPTFHTYHLEPKT